MRRDRLVLSVCLALASISAGCATSNSESFVEPYPGMTGSAFIEDVDRYHFPITTDSPEAQRWFDQGLQLVYGFNHGEAVRSFQEAAALDPEAAMPWWGIAYCQGMNINDPVVTPERWKTGHEAAQRALRLLDNESPMEWALVEAVATRYTWPAPAEQRPYDEAFADAMAKVYERFASNPDVAALYAESMMNLQPWDYWTTDGGPKGQIERIVAVIERGLEIDPDHPQLCHLYIHAVEASSTPERAEAAADRLLQRVPGSGHLVHMPSHLYVRVGRYVDATDANTMAVEADRRYFEYGTDPGAYWLYHAHNLHFLAYASMMEGRYETAMQAARDLESDIPDAVVDRMAWLIEGVMPTTYHVMVRFGRWEEILREPMPAEDRLISRAVHHYARGVALSALGRTEEARREIPLFEAAAARVPEEWWIFNNKAHDVLPIARAMLEGELAFREGRLEDAWASLRRGIAAEDRLVYDEPPGWMLPVRHAMGALLMSAGEYAEAERLYREDQKKHPHNGWSLLGLKQALEAQGRMDEAEALTPRIEMAWRRVNDRPTSSCLCEPGKMATAGG